MLGPVPATEVCCARRAASLCAALQGNKWGEELSDERAKGSKQALTVVPAFS